MGSHKHPPVVLNPAGRRIVEATIRDHAAYRNWQLEAVQVRTNHVHVVVGPLNVQPKDAANQFKAWCTRRLRENAWIPRDREVWAEGRSVRYLWDGESLDRAISYVNVYQGEPLLPGGPESGEESMPNP